MGGVGHHVGYYSPVPMPFFLIQALKLSLTITDNDNKSKEITNLTDPGLIWAFKSIYIYYDLQKENTPLYIVNYIRMAYTFRIQRIVIYMYVSQLL